MDDLKKGKGLDTELLLTKEELKHLPEISRRMDERAKRDADFDIAFRKLHEERRSKIPRGMPGNMSAAQAVIYSLKHSKDPEERKEYQRRLAENKKNFPFLYQKEIYQDQLLDMNNKKAKEEAAKLEAAEKEKEKKVEGSGLPTDPHNWHLKIPQYLQKRAELDVLERIKQKDEFEKTRGLGGLAKRASQTLNAIKNLEKTKIKYE